MTSENTGRSGWIARAQARASTTWGWLSGRFLPRTADVTGVVLRLFSKTPSDAEESHFLPSFCRGRAV
ncbi:MAG: hypothetical protein OEV31_02430, partial [Gammaproteobacteria bacterium]|nr:hypothetical protein [Gammaproteobacteria bacterium]